MKLELSLANEFCEIRDQGVRPTCVAFAASDLHAFCRSDRQKLSVEYAYYHAVQRCSPPDPRFGVTLDAIGNALEHDGQPVERDWPYLASLPVDLMAWKPPAKLGVIYRRASRAMSLSSDLADLIMKRTPVLLGIALTPGFYTPDSKGIVQESASEIAVGTHAVLAIGLGRSHEKQYFLVRNSWGRSWGKEGTGWLSDEYLQRRLMALMLMELP